MLKSRAFQLLFVSLFLVNFALSDDIQDQNLAMLVSYGLGDNPTNALHRYRYLYPSNICSSEREKIHENVYKAYSVVWSVDSLKSSIFNKQSYIHDLCNVVDDQIKNQPFVGVAHSRGAEMLLRYVAQYNPKNLKALVLVATPISVGQVAKQKAFGFIGAHCNIKLMVEEIKSIKNKSLPIVLLHQERDTLVSVENSQLLYKEFKKQGFKDVTLIIMHTGGHNDIADKASYKELQLWNQKHGLPCDSSWL